MYTLPILPDELRIPLDRYTVEGVDGKEHVVCEYPGVVAFVSPFDLYAASRWNDAIAAAPDTRSLQATAVVHRHLLRIEGLQLGDPTAPESSVAFDAKNPAHLRSIPMDMRDAIYLTLKKRGELGRGTEKNSELPSGSGGTKSGANTPAEAAPNAPATV